MILPLIRLRCWQKLFVIETKREREARMFMLILINIGRPKIGNNFICLLFLLAQQASRNFREQPKVLASMRPFPALVDHTK